ncbi:DUF262 domain-containing HNH endonuclease family protein [Flavobacterium sp. TR2]|uniref:DUF262 domain-containing protein n=1 Tax=Flavobacterium sp. TR2 TaxID=2977321 RepID=UPI0021B12B08|nr:DUF262 domain-containing HNH endonuclease family protein [Flavobacterium sp. TR2]UWY26355.1 DUF262 domain-containing HNH endonuclease family protein [Flavobacterium sp. TR2]
MKFTNQTILGFFDSSQKNYIIPVYQRAYSWERDQWRDLLDDLREQTQGGNDYFFGNILLETISEDRTYEIIDGQQRLTTLTILIRSILDVVMERQKNGEMIELEAREKESLYFKISGNKKLRPVDYDRACYDALIIEGNNSFITSSISQKKIKDAKIYFNKEVQKLTSELILDLLKKIETTKLTTIALEQKKDAALMFELQNNRGRDLTNMEKLKSYFMYQMYVFSKAEETNSNIESISNIFKLIYVMINDIKLNEDSVLIYHCNAFLKKGYGYRTLDDIKEEYKKSSDKVDWIIKFTNELHTTFSNIKKLENCTNKYYHKLIQLKIPAFIYPFFIKGYKYFGDDNDKMDKLFKMMEILVFRYNLINSRADIVARLNEVLVGFKGNIDNLLISLKSKLNESWYWGDERTKNYLNEWMYENSVLNYLLWEYETNIQNTGYVIGTMSLDREQIEHISPQTPPNNEKIASGYDVNDDNLYSDNFKNNYLNCLGNLMLISGSHNASIGNQPFKNKLASYNNNPLLNQQGEIKLYYSGKEDDPIWDIEAINKRHDKIHRFAVKRWSFPLLEI